LKSALFALAASLTLTAPAVAQIPQGATFPEPQPYPMPAPTPAPRDVPYVGLLKLEVDATDLDRRIFNVHETIPVSGAGPFTLLFPQWVPGGHSPRNALEKIAGITIRAGMWTCRPAPPPSTSPSNPCRPPPATRAGW
jgi:hypothetical protein